MIVARVVLDIREDIKKIELSLCDVIFSGVRCVILIFKEIKLIV